MSNAPQPQAVEAPVTRIDEARRAKSGTRRVALIGIVGVLTIAGFLAYRHFTAGHETTDDAMVDADVVPVSIRVGGPVMSLKVRDDAHVKKGDVLLELDATELRARLKQAEGELLAAKAQAVSADAQEQVAEANARGGFSTSKAQVSTSKAQVSSAAAQVATAHAQLARAESEVKRSLADLERTQALFKAGSVARQQLETAEAMHESAQAALQAAQAGLSAAQEARRVAESRVAEASGALDANAPIDAKIAAAKGAAELAHARVQTAEAAMELAKVALSYATVTAPADGTVSKLTVHEGQLLSPGQPIASIVPEATYVIANFKETQVGHIAAGQPVDVEVDAFPGQKFHGVVQSLAGGTGSRFSLLPPDNASGNFVKVVQRVPVRISWAELPKGLALRAGMSATATVDTERAPTAVP